MPTEKKDSKKKNIAYLIIVILMFAVMAYLIYKNFIYSPKPEVEIDESKQTSEEEKVDSEDVYNTNIFESEKFKSLRKGSVDISSSKESDYAVGNSNPFERFEE